MLDEMHIEIPHVRVIEEINDLGEKLIRITFNPEILDFIHAIDDSEDFFNLPRINLNISKLIKNIYEANLEALEDSPELKNTIIKSAINLSKVIDDMKELINEIIIKEI